MISLFGDLIALPFLVLAGIVDILFPNEAGGYIHYEGHFGSTCYHYKSWDQMSRAEKEDSAVRLFK